MAVEHTDTGVEAPALPANWDGEPRFVVFVIPAPQPLPLPHGSTFPLERDEDVEWFDGVAYLPTVNVPAWATMRVDPGKNFVWFRVWRLPEDVVLDASDSDKAFEVFAKVTKQSRRSDAVDQRLLDPRALPLGLTSYATVFEAATPLIPSYVDGKIDGGKSISDAFDRCIESLEELYRAYVTATADVRVRPLTRRTVIPLVPYATRDVSSLSFDESGTFIVNMADTSAVGTTETMSDEDLNKMLVILMRSRQGGPQADRAGVAAEHARRAQRAFFVDADYSVCIVWAYAWIEALCDGMLMVSAWEAERDVEEVATWFDVGFVKRVKTHFPKMFGGIWRPENSASIFGKWERTVAQMRHRIIHANHRASEKDAARALDTCGELEAYAKKRLAQKRHKYPRTALIFLGRPGLERRQAFDSYMAEVSEQGAHEPSWLASYADYAAEVDQLA